jgi:hypothetical protein
VIVGASKELHDYVIDTPVRVPDAVQHEVVHR